MICIKIKRKFWEKIWIFFIHSSTTVVFLFLRWFFAIVADTFGSTTFKRGCDPALFCFNFRFRFFVFFRFSSTLKIFEENGKSSSDSFVFSSSTCDFLINFFALSSTYKTSNIPLRRFFRFYENFRFFLNFTESSNTSLSENSNSDPLDTNSAQGSSPAAAMRNLESVAHEALQSPR